MMRKKRRNIRTMQDTMPLRDFVALLPFMDEDETIRLVERLRSQPRPDEICGRKVPVDLNMLTYGQLDDLQDIDENDDPASTAAEILFGIKKKDLYGEDINVVFGFIAFVTKELERINDLFASIKSNYSKEEIQAGVEDLKFGSFGVLDWYATRQGFHDQNDVRDVPWIRIYTCMNMDNEKNLYERRLREIYKPKKK